jgi:hypothetical protein
MAPVFAHRDAWGIYHSSRPISHTQLGLVVEAFIVSFLVLLLILVACTCLCSLWHHIVDGESYRKPRTDRDGRDSDLLDQRGPRIEVRDDRGRRVGHEGPTPGDAVPPVFDPR